MRINQKVKDIEFIIKAMHQGAIGGIIICKDEFAPHQALEHYKTLEEQGIFDNSTYNIIYDYEPISDPLLD